MIDKRTEWIETHARNMLTVWKALESPIRADESFLAHIRLELEMCYDDPLRKALIEATYSRQIDTKEKGQQIYGIAG